MPTEANTLLSEQDLFKNACRIHTAWTIDRYLMSNAVNRHDPAEKVERHIELCRFYVAAVRGCFPEDAIRDYEEDFDQLHDESQDLTSSLDTEIGFPLDQTPDYADLNPRFFERFHEIACRVLGVPALCATVKALRERDRTLVAVNAELIEGNHAAHVALDEAGIKREDVVWEGPVQHVTEYPVCDRIRFLQSKLAEVERELKVTKQHRNDLIAELEQLK